MEILAFIVTVVVGFIGASIFGNWMNWPDAGAVFAVATMGIFILRAIRNKQEK